MKTQIETKHTPGPWKIKDEKLNIFTIITDRNGNEVAKVQLIPDQRFDATKANARLIAAAPDLLMACQAVLVAIECGNHEHAINRSNPQTTNAIRSAIAKAL